MRIAQWFAQWDSARRDGIAALHAEIRGELKFPVGKREFTLSAIADRIELRRDGATPSSTTRPAQRAPKSRCAPGWRRN